MAPSADRPAPIVSPFRRWGHRARWIHTVGAALLAIGLGTGTALGATPAATPMPPREANGETVHPQDGPHGDLTIRISNRRVRVQVQVNLIFADELIDSFREDPNVLHAVEQEDLRADLIDWLREHTRLEVDGASPTFTPGTWMVTAPDLSRLPYYPRFGARALTVLRLELVYDLAAPPERVTYTWDTYPGDLALASEEGDAPPLAIRARFSGYGLTTAVDFETQAPTHTWVAPPPEERTRLVDIAPPQTDGASPWRFPTGALGAFAAIAALVLVARGDRRRAGLAATAGALLVVAGWRLPGRSVPVPPTANEAVALFHQLHQNLYLAFGFTEDEDIYDALARTVDQDLLEDLYTEIHDGLVQQEHDGLVSEVEQVTPLDTEVVAIGEAGPEGGTGFVVRARWQVQGAVHHFGHFHRRTTEYAANYSVVATDDGWRIAATEVLEQQRVKDETDDPNAIADPNARGGGS